MSDAEHIDEVLRAWAYDPNTLSVRLVNGTDGRDVLQMRIDMGVLQLELDGRPDGTRPKGFESFYDFLISEATKFGEEFVMD